MPHYLTSGNGPRFGGNQIAGVRVTIKAREITARNFQPDLMTLEKNHARGPEFDFDFPCWRCILCAFRQIELAPENAVANVERGAIRKHIHQLSAEIRAGR